MASRRPACCGRRSAPRPHVSSLDGLAVDNPCAGRRFPLGGPPRPVREVGLGRWQVPSSRRRAKWLEPVPRVGRSRRSRSPWPPDRSESKLALSTTRRSLVRGLPTVGRGSGARRSPAARRSGRAGLTHRGVLRRRWMLRSWGGSLRGRREFAGWPLIELCVSFGLTMQKSHATLPDPATNSGRTDLDVGRHRAVNLRRWGGRALPWLVATMARPARTLITRRPPKPPAGPVFDALDPFRPECTFARPADPADPGQVSRGTGPRGPRDRRPAIPVGPRPPEGRSLINRGPPGVADRSRTRSACRRGTSTAR